jgi:hypothetical protein
MDFGFVVNGISGVGVISGKAWSNEIPPNCQAGCREGVSLNLFELMDRNISIWIEVLAGRVPPESCLLAVGVRDQTQAWRL